MMKYAVPVAKAAVSMAASGPGGAVIGVEAAKKLECGPENCCNLNEILIL